MTAIVGLVRDGNVWIAADRQFSWGGSRKQDLGSKIIERDGIVFAWCGRGAMISVFQHRLDIPPVPENPDQHDRWLRVTLMDAIRAAVKGSGLADETDKDAGGLGCGIVAWRGRMIMVEDSWTTHEPINGMACEGSGGAVAMGALAALDHLDPPDAVRKAVEIACLYADGVGCGVDVVQVPNAETK